MSGRYRGLTMMAALAGLALGLLAPPALAQTGASVTATASATVVAPFTITDVAELRFGVIEPDDDEGGTVTVTFDNRRFATGDVELEGGGNFHRAEFTVTGTPGAIYTIGFPPAPQAKAEKSQSEPVLGVNSLPIIAFDPFTTTLGQAGDVGQIGEDGTDTIWLGGTLDVLPDAQEGNYRGDIEITLTFQ